MAELEFPRWMHKASKPIESKLVQNKEELEKLGEEWHPWKHEAHTAAEEAEQTKPVEIDKPSKKSTPKLVIADPKS